MRELGAIGNCANDAAAASAGLASTWPRSPTPSSAPLRTISGVPELASTMTRDREPPPSSLRSPFVIKRFPLSPLAFSSYSLQENVDTKHRG